MTLLLGLICSFVFANQKMAFMHETADGKKSIWIQGETKEQIETGFSFSIYPFLSKDGSEIAFVAGVDETNLNIYVQNLKTKKQTQVTQTAGFVLHPHIAASGNYLTYSEFTNGKNHLVIVDRKTNTQRTITDTASLYFPKLSSYASFIVYQKSISSAKKEIWLQKLDDNTSELISVGFEKCMAPNLNFDDSKLVMTCFKDNMWNLFLVSLATRKIEQITFTRQESYAPAFDRYDNIIFASRENEKFELHMLAKNQVSGAYSAASEPLVRMQGDLYAPSISGNLSYQTSIPTNIPAPARSSFGATHVNGKMYLFGGHQGREHTYPPESFLDRVDIYDIKTKTWSEGSPRPVLAHGYGVAACEDKIYAFGGFTYSADHKPKWKSVASVDRYDIASNTWTQVATLREPRSSNVVAKVGNKIYLIGGWDSTPKFENDYDGKFHRSIEIFNCETEKLETETLEIPDPLRRAFTGFVHNDKILLVGGLGVGASHFELLDNVTEFDPATKTFKELNPLPFATFAPAAGMINGNLHVFGGMFKTGEMAYEYVNHVYGMQNGLWFHTGRYLTETKGFSMVVPIDDALWVLGGHSYENNTDAPVPTIEIWK